MHWFDDLAIDGVEIVEIDEDSFQQHLEALYELSYKYDMIDLHEHALGDDKKIDLLAVADAGIRDVARVLVSMLIVVFDEWLEDHAITKPGRSKRCPTHSKKATSNYHSAKHA